MTPTEPKDYLESLVNDLNEAFAAACVIFLNNGLIPLDGIESGTIPLRLEFPAEWQTSPPSLWALYQIEDTLAFVDFWCRNIDELEAYSQSGKLGDVEPLPWQAKRWLGTNGYRRLINKLILICGQHNPPLISFQRDCENEK